MNKNLEKKFQNIALGGTFDHFHKGHQFLLQTAARFGENLWIGISDESLLKEKKFISQIQDFTSRKNNVLNFLLNTLEIEKSNIHIFPLHDPYGPAVTQKHINALACSVETYNNAQKINHLRQQKGYPPLILIVIPLIYDEENQKISSTDIRKNQL